MLKEEEEDAEWFDYLRRHLPKEEAWEKWPREKMLMKRRDWQDDRHLAAQAEATRHRNHVHIW